MDRRAQQIARLRSRAVELQAESDEALARGDAQGCARLADLAAIAEQAADLLEAGEGGTSLQKRHQSGTTEGMVSAARAHISAGRSKQARGGKSAHPLIVKASAKGHTYRSLATAIKNETGRETPHSIISRALSGSRPIRRSAARVIEKLTGYEASDKNWPGGWATED